MNSFNNLIKKLNTNNDKLSIILSLFPDYISAENFQSEHIDILKNIYDSNNIYYKDSNSNSNLFLSYNSYSKLSNSNKNSYNQYLKKKDTINITTSNIKKIKKNKENKNEELRILKKQAEIKKNKLNEFMSRVPHNIIGLENYENYNQTYKEYFDSKKFTVQIDRNQAIQFKNQKNFNEYQELIKNK